MSTPLTYPDRPLKCPTPIGTAIRNWRHRRRMSQPKFAELWGVDHAYVSRIESGTRNAGTAQIAPLAHILELPEWEVALMVCGYDPEAIKDAIREELRPEMRREALLSIMNDAERKVFELNRKPPFHDLVKQLEKGEIDLDTFILTAEEMGVSRNVVEAVVTRGEKRAA